MSGQTVKRSVAPVRVAHFYSSLGIYGAERWALTLLKYLDRRRVWPIIVTVGTKAGSRLLGDAAAKEGYDTFHIDVPGKLNPRAIFALRTFLVEKQIEVLHTHGFKSDILGYLATRGMPIRLVSTPHGWSAEEDLRIRLYESIGRLSLRRFDRIYPLSHGLLTDLEQQGFDAARLRLILNAVDIAPFDSCFRTRRARAAGAPFTVLFAGRLCKPKGVSFLIEAMATAAFRCPAQLHIVGDGPDRDELEQLGRDRGLGSKVRFFGVVDDITPFLAGSDVLVLPSFREGTPRIIMEAFAAGTPVIGTSIPGIRGLIDEARTGLLVGVGDAGGLARALTRLASDPALAQRLARAARSRVEESFSASRLARDLEADYEQLVRPPAPRLALVSARSHLRMNL
jgi:glycosyltransferase involved in cell wall biosynthesis